MFPLLLLKKTVLLLVQIFTAAWTSSQKLSASQEKIIQDWSNRPSRLPFSLRFNDK
jgi:hypothetical protein